jgi:hypothetical protein
MNGRTQKDFATAQQLVKSRAISQNHVGMLAIIALVPCLLFPSGCMLVGPDYKALPLQAPTGFANKVGNQC